MTEPRVDFPWPLTNSPVLAWMHANMLCAIGPGMGSLNGYVRLMPDHPLHNHPYDKIDEIVEVHGGLTYGVDNPDYVDDMRKHFPSYKPRTVEESLGWVGFDTAHAWDYWPEEELTRGGYTDRSPDARVYRMSVARMSDPRTDNTWTVDKLIEETNHLANQLAALRP